MTGFVLLLMLAGPQAHADMGRVKVFLDCTTDCFADYLREETTFVDFVRDRKEAALHVIVTSTSTASGGREYVLGFTGLGPFTGRDHSVKTVTETGDPEDVRRRQLLNALKIGLLHYLAADIVPAALSVDVALGRAAPGPASPREDPWKSWVFSLRGSANIQGEESSRERGFRTEISADRITPDWKFTLGIEVDRETEEFDLDEDEPVKTNRREFGLSTLLANGLGEHWSIGAMGEIRSSTFDNIELSLAGGPAVEFNLFPYSAYQRRQLRTAYVIGVQHQRYYEETLFGEFEETLPLHELSVTYDQRERWGSVEGRLEWLQYLHDLSKYHLDADAEVSWRIVRGLSISADASASRIRDQLSLRRRGATDEEILLRLRELQSGYEYDFSVSLTYTFGSIFSSIVNPRFGQ